MELTIPGSLKAEHDELHAELAEATKVEGPIGNAAKKVAEVLHPHFLKEEEYALPPLGLLSSIMQQKITPEAANAVAMTERLKKDLPRMLAEHQQVLKALENLKQAAKSEQQEKYVRFAEKLALHAKTEEEVLYPAAILAGEYVKARLGRKEQRLAKAG